MSIRHVGIVVDNLEKMVEFYNLLGFKELNRNNLSGELIDKLIFAYNFNVDIVKLVSLKDNSIIELLKYNNVNQPRKNKELYDKGLSHNAFTVDNIDEMCKILELAGARFNSPPLFSEKVKVCFCRDIEGNFIELVEDLRWVIT